MSQDRLEQASDPGHHAAPHLSLAAPAAHSPILQPPHLALHSAPVAIKDTMVPDTSTVLRAIRRHWLLIGIVGLIVGSATATAVWMAIPGKYVATAILRVRSIPPHLVFPNGGGADNVSFSMYLQTQRQMMQMPRVLDAALNELTDEANRESAAATTEPLHEPFSESTVRLVHRQMEPVKWLNKQIQINASERSEFMRVSAANDDPFAARDVANALVRVYLREVNKAKEETTARHTALERLARQQQRELEDKFQALKTLALRIGGTDSKALDMQKALLVDNLGLLSKSLLQTRFDILQTQVKLEMAIDARDQARTFLGIDQAEANSTGATNAEAAVPELEVPPTGAADRTAEDPPAEDGVLDSATADGSAADDPPAGDEQQSLPPADDPAVLLRMIQQDPVVKTYRRQIDSMLRQIEAAQLKAQRSDEPSLIRMRAQLEIVRKHLAERQAEIEPKIKVQLRKGLARKYDLEVNQLTAQLQQLQNQEQAISKSYDQERGKIEESGGRSFELEMARRNITRSEGLLKRVEDLIQQMEIESGAPDRIEVFQWAEAPTSLDNSRRTKLAAFGAAGGFGLVACLIGFIEIRRQRIMVPDDVAYRVGVAVVGTVPELPFRARRIGGRGVVSAAPGPWYRVFQESVDALRAQLMFSHGGRALRSVMVTSAVAGEGKTVLATHLAVSLARAGQRTLLIDLDLRQPAVHELFDAPVGPGLVDVLNGAATAEQAVVHSPFVGLDLLMAGQRLADPAKVLSEPALAALLAQFRQEYAFVVVDLPPVLPFSDALLVGQHVDGALFSVLRDVSQTHHLRSASNRLRGVGVQVLGAVLSGVTYEDYMYQHYYADEDESGHDEQA